MPQDKGSGRDYPGIEYRTSFLTNLLGGVLGDYIRFLHLILQQLTVYKKSDKWYNVPMVCVDDSGCDRCMDGRLHGKDFEAWKR
jgi:hypothetical protein